MRDIAKPSDRFVVIFDGPHQRPGFTWRNAHHWLTYFARLQHARQPRCSVMLDQSSILRVIKNHRDATSHTVRGFDLSTSLYRLHNFNQLGAWSRVNRHCADDWQHEAFQRTDDLSLVLGVRQTWQFDIEPLAHNVRESQCRPPSHRLVSRLNMSLARLRQTHRWVAPVSPGLLLSATHEISSPTFPASRCHVQIHPLPISQLVSAFSRLQPPWSSSHGIAYPNTPPGTINSA